jgi:cell division protein FtsZ
MIDFSNEEQLTLAPSIKVIGVGGAGGNTVNSLIQSGCDNIYCIAANTDAQALDQSHAQLKIQLGVKSTKGLGTGANPEIGKHAAEEDLDKIMQACNSADIVFLTAGMGGGTGSGALPVIARALKDEGVLTIAVITTPFTFEGKRRAGIAHAAIAQLESSVDALIIIPNQRLLDIVDHNVSLLDSFAMINDMLSQSVKGIADIITKPGYINVDFADLKAIMKNMGLAIMGTGRASGQDRASFAALQAISSPLLENMTIKGARSVLLNIAGGHSMGLHEINEAASIIYEQASEDAHIIVGAVIDESLEDDISVSVIATGFEKNMSLERSINITHDAQVAERQVSQEGVIEPSEISKEKQVIAAQKIEDEKQEVATVAATRAAVKDKDIVELNDKDLEDLDVPSFMRKQTEEERKI